MICLFNWVILGSMLIFRSVLKISEVILVLAKHPWVVWWLKKNQPIINSSSSGTGKVFMLATMVGIMLPIGVLLKPRQVWIWRNGTRHAPRRPTGGLGVGGVLFGGAERIKWMTDWPQHFEFLWLLLLLLLLLLFLLFFWGQWGVFWGRGYFSSLFCWLVACYQDRIFLLESGFPEMVNHH